MPPNEPPEFLWSVPLTVSVPLFVSVPELASVAPLLTVSVVLAGMIAVVPVPIEDEVPASVAPNVESVLLPLPDVTRLP